MKKLLNYLAGVLLLSQVGCQSTEELKREQYYAEGYRLYIAHCANCHQPDGRGLANLYPPLAGSHYLLDKQQFICISKNGLSGEITVDGKVYDRPMPANPQLTDIDLAEITTYVYNTWGQDSTYTPIDTVTQALGVCATRR